MTPAERTPGRRRTAALIGVLLANALILGHFYDRFCWPPDDGHYAHIAERILNGETLHVDIEEFHPGNTHAINAVALAILGTDLRSLRVPIVFATIAQSLMVFWLFQSRALRTGVIAALATTSLSFVQYLNPQPHWYCLTLAIATVAVLAGPARWRFRSLVVLGALVATTFLFRQLTGAFLAMGVVGYLLLEGPADRRGAERGGAAASRALLMLMAGVLLAYSVRVANGSGFLLLGLWPVSLLLWGAVRCRVANRELLGLLAGLGCGALGAAIPTLGYHVLHGSLAEWFRDCVLSAWRVESLPYVKAHSYFGIMTAAVSELRGGGALDGIVNNLYWMLLPLMGVVNGVSLLVYLARSPEDRRPAAALPYIAAFYGMVSLFNQIPMYLYYALGLLVPGVLWTRTAGAPRRGSVWEPIIVAVGIVALYFHAAQPATRTLAEVVDGVRIPLVQNTRIPRTSLWLEPRVVDAYGDLVDIIQRETQPDGTIFVLPNHPEVYFFAQRTNPFWFPNTSLAVQDPNALDRVLRELAARPPALVIYAPLDRHRTAMSDEIIAFVERRYERIATIGEFVVYRRPPPASDRAASP